MTVAFKSENDVKTFPDRNSKFVTNRPALKAILKEVLQAEGT